jgi:DNA invertase Pin-like site-specific DNA recombinase
MPPERKASIRCAIYTRKSSEEGLEQSFNSLDAQREACQSYIESQRHEGWCPIATHYDDGGYSGATMERPALRRLLDDIEAHKIDTVVVYKVDRLTRSLADFAKIIEIFDARSVSFVSVTQQFNTTTSMGRLTLNVLLSFAQFEREVTGERIRDKIAASKRKGMWMGGMPPLGYDLKNRKLIVNEKEAACVRDIYRRYLKLGCVSKLKADLDRRGILSKKRRSQTGRNSGGAPYSRGALYQILQNRSYLGEIAHRGQVFPGEHDSIVSRKLWDRVQARLKANNQGHRNGTRAAAPSLLAGLIYDSRSNRFTPSHAVKNGKRYRYYVSQARIQHRPGAKGALASIPAHEIETLVASKLRSFLASAKEVVDTLRLPSDDPSMIQALVAAAQGRLKPGAKASPAEMREFLRAVISRIVVHEKRVEILAGKRAMRHALLGRSPIGEPPGVAGKERHDLFRLVIQARLKRCGGEVRLMLPAGSSADNPARTPPSLIKAIARAHHWYERIMKGEVKDQRSIAKQTGLDERYLSRIFQCAFLAPDIVETILRGSQPPDLTLERLRVPIPLDWSTQRRRFGWAISAHLR